MTYIIIYDINLPDQKFSYRELEGEITVGNKHLALSPQGSQQQSRSSEPACGQVLVIAFEATLEEVREGADIDEEQVPLVIKPHYDRACWKFPGGMLTEAPTDEAFRRAIDSELSDETGVDACKALPVLLYETEKRRHGHHGGTFPVRLYAVFGCDFSHIKNPLFGDTGDEGEVVRRVRFGDIGVTDGWGIPTEPNRVEPFFEQYLKFIDGARRNLHG